MEYVPKMFTGRIHLSGFKPRTVINYLVIAGKLFQYLQNVHSHALQHLHVCSSTESPQHQSSGAHQGELVEMYHLLQRKCLTSPLAQLHNIYFIHTG